MMTIARKVFASGALAVVPLFALTAQANAADGQLYGDPTEAAQYWQAQHTGDAV